MMNNIRDIERAGLIDPTLLNEEFYLQSLITEGYKKGILQYSDVEKIQFFCFELLSHKIEQYNSGFSGSIREEVAKSIMSSIGYTIGISLKEYPNADYAATALKEIKISELYSKGLARIDLFVKETKTLYIRALKNKVVNQNSFYNVTFDRSLKKIIKKYNSDFAAHEICIIPEYPLCNLINGLVGIEFVKSYVESIYYENKFCRNFSSENIHLLLCCYDDSYIDVPVNIYHYVLKAAIGCIIAKKNIQKLRLTENDLIYINNTFKDESVDGINRILFNALVEITNILKITNSSYRHYMKTSLNVLASEIHSRKKIQTNDMLFITRKQLEDEDKIYFNTGERMDCRQYRSVLSKMMKSGDIIEKIKIIKTQISSLDDFEDIVLDAELSANEIFNVLAVLDNTTIAVLSKKCSLEINTAFNLNEKKHFLYRCLSKFIASLSVERQKSVSNIAVAIEID